MSATAKKGDLAVIVPWARRQDGTPIEPRVVGCRSGHLGDVVKVLSDPEVPRVPQDWEPGVLINHVDAPCGCRAWLQTKFLIPIRDPDQSVSTVTRKTAEA